MGVQQRSREQSESAEHRGSGTQAGEMSMHETVAIVAVRMPPSYCTERASVRSPRLKFRLYKSEKQT